MTPSEIYSLIVNVFAVIGVGGVGFLVFAKWVGGRLTAVTDAYATETAKMAAQFHNLDKLVDQTRELTTTAETIKAELSDAVWGKQQRWSKRLEYCTDVVKCLASFEASAIEVVTLGTTIEGARNHPDKDLYQRLLNSRMATMSKYNSALANLLNSRDLALVVAGDKAREIMNRFTFTSMLPVFMDIAKGKEPDFGARALQVAHAHVNIRKEWAEFVAAIRADLGYEP